MFPHAGLELIPRAPGAPDDTWRFRVSAHSRCFDGHFDGAPIFPGVAHLALALQACALRSGQPGRLKGLRELRLRHPLVPGDDVAVTLTADRASSTVRFEIRCRGQAASSGTLIFQSPDERTVA